MTKQRWLEVEDRKLLEWVAAWGPDRTSLANHLGRSVGSTNSRTQGMGDRYRQAVAGWEARMRAQGTIAPFLRVNGTSAVRQRRVGPLTVDLRALKDDLIADIKRAVPRRSKAVQKRSGGLLHVWSPADLHIGKLSWEPETGEDFDSKIASEWLTTVTDKVLSHVNRYDVTRHLLVVGNDLVQVDNLISTTTAGTFQDTDSRYRKMFRMAVQLMREQVERLVETAPVSVLVVPGNHDQLASFHVGEVLQAVYSKHPMVSVSPSLMPRLYYRHGNTLLGFCHGNEEKHADLPLVMAQENPVDWGQTTYREFLVGHLHKKRERSFMMGDSHNGVRVVTLPSLTGTDSWHAKKGYIGEPKASESRLYDRVDGLVATFTGRAK